MIYKLIPVVGQQCFTWLFNINPNRPQLHCMYSLIKLWCTDILLWELSIMENNCFYDFLFLVIYWHWKCDIHYPGNNARMLGLHLILLLLIIMIMRNQNLLLKMLQRKIYLGLSFIILRKCMKDTLHCTKKQ